jgi:hypothetical protein
LNLHELELLQTPAGRAALAEAVELAPEEGTYLNCFGRLSKGHEAQTARAALATAMLRRRAASKFSRAAAMFFEREALEQSSSESVAAHRTRRMGAGRIADLCCGLGGDAIALAERAEVVAVDLDPLRLRLCGLNLAAYERRAALIEADALTVDLSGVDAVFVDPDRRVEGRRQLSFSTCRPPLSEVLRRLPAGSPVCAKLAPGVPWAEVAALGGEVEFVSLEGELKECAVWLGPYRSAARRATVLPSGAELTADEPAASPGCAPPGRYLYDPDPAVVRAGLVTDLAGSIGAWQLDAEIAYLSGDALAPTPFARAYAVEESLPFNLSRLRELLRARGVGAVQVRRRGSAVDPEELIRKLKLRGGQTRTLVLTRVEGRPWVLLTAAV